MIKSENFNLYKTKTCKPSQRLRRRQDGPECQMPQNTEDKGPESIRARKYNEISDQLVTLLDGNMLLTFLIFLLKYKAREG